MNRSIVQAPYLGACWCLLIALLFGSDTSAIAEHGVADFSPSLQVGCVPDRPLVHPGESVTITTWVTDSKGNPVEPPVAYDWSASAGNLAGGPVASWSFALGTVTSDTVKKATAELVVTHENLGRARCELLIYVTKPAEILPGQDRSVRFKRRRTLLLRGQRVPRGYGLYSYLLFDTPPRDAVERARHLKAIESYLLILEPLAEMELHRRRSQINLTLLPLKHQVDLSDNLSDAVRAAQVAQQVMEVYDYRRAQDLLSAFDVEAVRSGPYLVSTTAVDPAAGQPRLFVDMSHVVPKLVWDWVKAFCNLAAQERSWSEITLTKLALNTRNFLAVAAKDLPGLAPSVADRVKVM